LHDRGQLIELLARIRRREMPLVDVEQFGEIARARGIAAFLRCSELLQVQVADAGFIKPGRKLALGESRPARGSDSPRVDDHEAGARAPQLSDHGVRLRLLVADGEERLHFVRSINSIAAAGARTFPSWIT